MPEVSEVALTAEIINKKYKNLKLKKIKIMNGRYSRKNPDGFEVFVDSLPLRLKKVNSKGKFMWFEFIDKNNNEYFIFNTFGLDGMWSFEKNNKHDKFKFVFEDENKDKIKLYYNDVIGYGTFTFKDSRDELDKKLKNLGLDFLKEKYSDKDIWKKIKKLQLHKNHKNKKIVEVLMNQKLLGSGIGNYLVAEILYRAKISPHKLISDFDKKLSYELSKSIKYTVKLSYISNKAGYMTILDKYLENHKFKNYHPDVEIDCNFEFRVYQQEKDPCGNKVTREKIVNGRTTHWVKKIQK